MNLVTNNPRDSQNREAQGAESPAKSLDYTKEV